MLQTYKFYSKIVIFIFLFNLFTFEVNADTQVGTVNVTAVVLGEKPIVNSFAPTAGTNTGAITLTKIVGRNFDNVYGVSLDDANSTVLAGTITLNTGCDFNGDNCESGGSYQSITGLSVPSGVIPGVYNVLVTTPLGTNLLSDTKYTVDSAVATVKPSINNIQPGYISVMANLADTVTINFTIKDSDSAAVEFDTDSNISIGGVTTSGYFPSSQTTNAANFVDGETVSFVFNSNSVAETYGTLDIRVGDGGSGAASGNTNFKVVDIFVEPSW